MSRCKTGLEMAPNGTCIGKKSNHENPDVTSPNGGSQNEYFIFVHPFHTKNINFEEKMSNKGKLKWLHHHQMFQSTPSVTVSCLPN